MRNFFVCVALCALMVVGVMAPRASAQKAAPKEPVIEINEGVKDGKFRFKIVGADGKTLALSIGAGYPTEKACMKAVEDLKAIIGKARIVKNLAKKPK